MRAGYATLPMIARVSRNRAPLFALTAAALLAYAGAAFASGAGGTELLAPLVTAFVLGLTHGITPDEHTWPITFNYAIGSYSARGGVRAGLLFSLTFTVQRAIASELAYFALLGFLKYPRWPFVVYALAGTIMFVSGRYVLARGHAPHVFERGLSPPTDPRAVPTYMPLVHGFVAGWGTGAFALTVYTVLAPATGSPYFAFLPGVAFGLGTMATQILLGAAIGGWMARRRLNERARAFVARKTAGRTLFAGGAAFVIVGIAGALYPRLAQWKVDTGVPLAHLRHLDVGLFLVVLVLLPTAAYAFLRSLKEARAMGGKMQDTR